jgi:hypothetical protein
MQLMPVLPPLELQALDVFNPAVPELKFTPAVLLTLIPQLYWEKIEADIHCEKPTLGYPTGQGAPLEMNEHLAVVMAERQCTLGVPPSRQHAHPLHTLYRYI